MPKTKSEPATKLTQTAFRLDAPTLADLDLIAAEIAEQTGLPVNRTDALRVLIRERAKKLKRKIPLG